MGANRPTEERKDAGTRAKRVPRRGMRRARRPLWVSGFRRLKRALDSSLRMIDSTMREVERASDRAAERPIRTTRDLQRLSKRLTDALRRLGRAVRAIRETTDSMLLEPGQNLEARRLLVEATARWLLTAQALTDTSWQIVVIEESVLADLRSGAVVPEAETPRRRPRIVTIPRLITARDFLLCRRSSALDRIASIPARRRRTSCRRAADAPRRISRGRAPPLLSDCLL